MSDEALNSGGGISDSGSSAPAESVSSSSAAPAESPTIDSIFDEVAGSLGEGTAPSDTVSEESPAPEPVPATEAPQDATPPETPAPPSPGEPPKERWPDILNNARQKEREAVLQHVVQQYGEPLRVVEALKSDPVGTVVQLISELQADPRFAKEMASHAARTLRAARGAESGSDEPQPDLDAGNGVLLYSAQQQAKWQAWSRAQLQREMQQEWQQALAPVLQDHEARKAQEQRAAESQRAMTKATERLAKWADRPHFREHKDAIRAKQAEYYQAGMDTWDALSAAYADVLTTKVVPSVQAKREQDMVAQAAQKLRAATANPSATAPAASRKARDLDDAFDLAVGEVMRSA